ncbi:MAG: 1,6-anhydro-N-acetylmuramyl-L-alanine amidase AmpD [Gammaproteobacteria bacterium]|nr:MAG: 1,6-anhydro-N-acetylmuramyl-L-alanine amidase AmpD [Gammaproteobacteria bacterium]
MLTIEDHQLTAVKQVQSPNFNDRPSGAEIELIVIHSISLPPGEYGGAYIEALFTNNLDPLDHPYFETIYKLEVSSHLLIDRQGQIVQFVPFNKRAWHAGKSCYQGRENCNDFSIGIELEGLDTDQYEPVQYETLAAVLKALFACYPKLGPDTLIGHENISPGRKTDPGPGFNWSYLQTLLSA